MGELIGTATPEKNGLATMEMAKFFGYEMNASNNIYVKFTQLVTVHNRGYVEIVLFQTAGWSVDYPIKLIIAMTADGTMQAAKAELICGDKTKVSLYKDSDNYLYIKHHFLYNAAIYIKMRSSVNALIKQITTTPPELTEITIS